MRKISTRWTLIAIAAQALICVPVSAVELGFGETAAREIEYLSQNLAGRSVGTQKEQETVDYLSGQLNNFGYQPSLQTFSFELGGQTLTSSNIIAERKGTSGKQIIIGAHYDTAPSSATLDRSTLQGTNDNASGVGVLLELAQRLEAETNNTVKFVLFGAEEVGLVGSEHYASNMSEAEIANTLVMVNMDSLVVGDKMYFHAGLPAATDPALGHYRDLALDIAQKYGIAAETNPGLNPEYPKGTGCCSDLESFENLVPVLATEATNWDIGDLDGYTQTTNPNVPGGATWHDPATDNLEFINGVFPGLIEERTHDYTLVLDTFIDRVDAKPIPEPSSIVGTAIVGIGLLVRRSRKRKSPL